MYWIRQIEVNAGGKVFESIGDNALDIEFEIPFSDKNEPDVSTISIYNLSEDSINSIEKQGNVSVSAGYRDMHNVAEVLSGQIESIKTEWKGLDLSLIHI